MDRIKAPNGSQINFENLVDSVQTKAFSNLKKRVSEIFGSMGLNVAISNGLVGPEFETTLISSNATVSVASGKALTTAGNYINITSSLTTDNLVTSNANKGYAVKLTYAEAGSDPVKAVNAFVFDKLGSESLNRKTVFSDSVSVSLQEITTDLAAVKSSLSTDQIIVAAVWDSTGTFDASAAGLSSYDTTTSGDYRVADLRKDTRLLLSTSIFDEGAFFFKDRDNSGNNGVSGKVDFNGDVGFRTLLPVSGVSDSEITTATLNLDTLTFTSGNEQSTNLQGTTASVFYIDGKPAVTGDGSLTTPSNLRIYDITPSPNHEEKNSLVSFKWNYDALAVDTITSTTVEVSELSYDNETFTFNSGDVVGKNLYFTETTNSYKITAVGTGSTADKVELTVEGDPSSEDDTTPSTSARIIDDNVNEYLLQVDSNEGYSFVQRLNKAFRLNPSFTMKLTLDESYTVSIQALNLGSLSAIKTMQAGSYDPDHSSGGQAVVNYDSLFENALPPISTLGAFTASADAQGFSVQISGWRDAGDLPNSAHSFEILYSSQVDLNSTSFDNLDTDQIERQVIQTRTLHISSGKPTKFSVAVRALQNGYPVSDPIIKEVTSGGGGIYPTDNVLANTEVDIEVIDIEISTITGTSADIIYKDQTGTQMYVGQDFLRGRTVTALDGGGDPVVGSDYHISRAWDYTNTGTHKVTIDDITGLTTTTILRTGVSKQDRKIFESAIDADYIVTKLEFIPHAVTGATQVDPGIIRVYQKGVESSAVMLEVPSFQEETIIQATDLPISILSDGTRKLVIDAWDPDSSDPNNDCSIKGEIIVTGRPKVVNNLS